MTPYFFIKIFLSHTEEETGKIRKNSAEWNFADIDISIFFNLSKIYSAESFLIFPVSSTACNKKTFIKKISGHRLSFKIDAIDGKKWVNSPTLIYDLNTTKGTVEESP